MGVNMRLRLLGVLLLLLVVAVPSKANAALIVVSLPDFDGPSHGVGSAFPIDLGNVGAFNFVVPAGEAIVSATFSGTYGTALVPNSTAGFDAVIGGQTIVVCVPFAANCWQVGDALRPFSFGLNASTFPTLATGAVGLQLIMTSEDVVRLGTPTLTINTQAVPEPMSLLLFASALGATALRRRIRGRI